MSRHTLTPTQRDQVRREAERLGCGGTISDPRRTATRPPRWLLPVEIAAVLVAGVVAIGGWFW